MPFPPLTKDEVIELWRRINPTSYTEPIETEYNGQGFDIPSSQAEIFSQADAQVDQTFQAHYLKPSPLQTSAPSSGPRRATTTVQISRSTSSEGDLPLSRGTRLVAEQLGSLGQTIVLVDFELLEEVLLPSGDRGPIPAQVQAVLPGYFGNVAAGSIVGFRELGRAQVEPCTVNTPTVLERVPPPPGAPLTDRFTGAMLGRFVTLLGLPSGVQPPFKVLSVDEANQRVVLDPPLAAGDVGATGIVCQVAELEDLGVTVEQPDDATGGLLATLDAIGFDRKAGRVVGEGDPEYRQRLCELDDTISPGAIGRIADRVLTPCGINYQIKETRDVATLKGFVWDIDPYDFGQIPPVPNNGVGDLFGEGAVFMSEGTATSFFIICVGFGNGGEFGAAYDAAAVGMTPPNAWSQFFWDGQPVVYNSCLGQLWEQINGAKGAGVAWQLFQDPGLT
jgi:hypothetical protein